MTAREPERTHPLSRRAVLRGLGATFALPYLESWAWAEAGKPRFASPPKPPVRWGCFLWANGVNVDQWWAKGDGPDLQLSPTLAPLAPFKRDILVLQGLHVYNDFSGPHWPLFSNYLNGVRLRPSLIPEAGVSIDQLIARETGRITSTPSLTLGVEPAETGLRGGVPSVLYGTVSWSSPNTPVPPEIYPRAVFDRLFDTTGLLRDRSVVDAVLEQTAGLTPRLGRQDRQKLDEFLHSVRDLEVRLDRAAREERLEGWKPTLTRPDLPRPADLPPQDVADHMRLMLDLILLAYRMDKTRVATLIFNRDVSHMKFGFLDGVLNDQLHGISHHKRDAQKLASYQRINRFHLEQFAGLLERMRACDEGDGSTLLDNAMLTIGSNMGDGDRHDGRSLPLVLAGHGGGTLKPGRVVDYSARPEREQRLCNLHLALAQRMGLAINAFGDSVAPLVDLS